MLVKLEIFPNFRGENKKYLSCHHLASQGFGSAKGSTFTTDPLGCSTIHQPKIEMTCPRLKMGELFIRLANQRPGFLSSNSHLTMGEDCTKHLVIALTWRLLGRGRFETWLTRSLHVRQHTMCLKFCWRYGFKSSLFLKNVSQLGQSWLLPEFWNGRALSPRWHTKNIAGATNKTSLPASGASVWKAKLPAAVQGEILAGHVCGLGEISCFTNLVLRLLFATYFRYPLVN